MLSRRDLFQPNSWLLGSFYSSTTSSNFHVNPFLSSFEWGTQNDEDNNNNNNNNNNKNNNNNNNNKIQLHISSSETEFKKNKFNEKKSKIKQNQRVFMTEYSEMEDKKSEKS